MQLTKKLSSAIIDRTFCKMVENAPRWRTDFCTVSDGGFSFLFAAKIHIERMNEYFGTQI